MMKYFDAAAKIRAGADANQKIYFHHLQRKNKNIIQACANEKIKILSLSISPNSDANEPVRRLYHYPSFLASSVFW